MVIYSLNISFLLFHLFLGWNMTCRCLRLNASLTFFCIWDSNMLFSVRILLIYCFIVLFLLVPSSSRAKKHFHCDIKFIICHLETGFVLITCRLSSGCILTIKNPSSHESYFTTKSKKKASFLTYYILLHCKVL